MRKQKGYSLFELVFVLVAIAGAVAGGTLLYWVVRALIKFVGA